MVFNSIIFVSVFLPLTVGVHALLYKWNTARNLWLVALSFLFYGWCNTKMALFLAVFGLANYWFGRLMASCDHKSAKNLVLIPSLIFNIGYLFVCKYLNFSISVTNRIFGTELSPFESLLVPLGISFLVFTAISYLVDIYKEKCKPITNIIDYFLYISFFPKISQGPITACTDMQNDLKNRTVSLDNFTAGLRRFCFGLAKKVLIADTIGKSVDMVFDNLAGGISVGTAWLGILCYAFQIYYDFSGYTDMAIGIGKMLGFSLPENFDFPYLSRSVSEFWRRWHMTLGRWYKNYIYIPMGGNRCSTLRVIFNLAVVWFLTGLWHGASFNYILWGVYFGIFVIAEKFITKLKFYNKIPSVLKWASTFFICVMGWILFRSADMSTVLLYLKSMFGLIDSGTVIYGLGYYFDSLVFIALGLSVLLTLPRPKILTDLRNKHLAVSVVYDALTIAIFVITFIFMVNSTYNAFIYFQF